MSFPTNTKVLNRFDKVNRFFIGTDTPQVFSVVEVSETLATLSDGCMVKRTPNEYGNYELKYFGEGSTEERVYCARREPVWTPEQRQAAEDIYFKRKHKDYKGITNGVRSVLHLSPGQGTCLVPLSSLTNTELFDDMSFADHLKVYLPRP